MVKSLNIRRDYGIFVQITDVRDGLSMSFEDAQRLARVSNVIEMDTVVGRAEDELVLLFRTEVDTTDIYFGLDFGHGAIAVDIPN